MGAEEQAPGGGLSHAPTRGALTGRLAQRGSAWAVELRSGWCVHLTQSHAGEEQGRRAWSPCCPRPGRPEGPDGVSGPCSCARWLSAFSVSLSPPRCRWLWGSQGQGSVLVGVTGVAIQCHKQNPPSRQS